MGYLDTHVAPYDLTQFDLSDMLQCGKALRLLARESSTLEAIAARTVRHLYEECRDKATGARQCTLVRFYKTHVFGKLDKQLQQFATKTAGDAHLTPETRCLTLIASAGEHPSWNDRRKSKGHQAIPLLSVEMIERAPMISQLMKEFGVQLADVVKVPQGPAIVESVQGSTYNVFHVEDAMGSPFIPAQKEFVEPYNVKSVIGFGGSMAMGELFAVVMFTKVAIDRANARRFRNVALDLKAEAYRIRDHMVFGGV